MDYTVTWKTERGEFRIWVRYADRAKRIARELKAMGATGIEVYNDNSNKVAYQWGEATSSF